MPDYKSMYFQLFNKITDVVELLQSEQLTTEDSYIESEEPALTILTNDKKPTPDNVMLVSKKFTIE